MTPQELEAYLAPLHIGSGLGTKEGESCSLGYINLALQQPFGDSAPPSMSKGARNVIVTLNDAIPDAMRNSARWKRAIAQAAFTGREHEPERAQIVLDWMWETVLPELQTVADKHGFGEEWREMCEKKTAEAARAAARAEGAASLASVASDAAWATAAGARAAAAAASLAAATAARRAEAIGADAGFWQTVDPCGLIERMNAEGGQRTDVRRRLGWKVCK